MHILFIIRLFTALVVESFGQQQQKEEQAQDQQVVQEVDEKKDDIVGTDWAEVLKQKKIEYAPSFQSRQVTRCT